MIKSWFNRLRGVRKTIKIRLVHYEQFTFVVNTNTNTAKIRQCINRICFDEKLDIRMLEFEAYYVVDNRCVSRCVLV
jgi:hypothetical protein